MRPRAANPTPRTLLAAVLLVVLAAAPPQAARAQPLADQHIRGVNYAHVHRGSLGYGSPVSERELARLHGLGVNWVALTPFAYQRTATDARLYGYPGDGSDRRDHSLTEDHLLAEMRHARALGVKVLLKPHVWSGDFWSGDEWHGTIRQLTPTDAQTWWEGYRRFVLYQADLAERGGAEALCIGTELVAMTRGDAERWRALIDDVRTVYSGLLTYAAHWNGEFEQIGFWDRLDAIGINAYFPLNAGDNATVAELTAAWAPARDRIRRVQWRVGKPVVFTEIGYRPVTGTHREPWAYGGGGTPDQAAAGRAYQAVFRAMNNEPWFRGFFLWKTFTDPRRSRRGDDPTFSFQHQPVERIIARWFGGDPDTAGPAPDPIYPGPTAPVTPAPGATRPTAGDPPPPRLDSPESTPTATPAP